LVVLKNIIIWENPIVKKKQRKTEVFGRNVPHPRAAFAGCLLALYHAGFGARWQEGRETI